MEVKNIVEGLEHREWWGEEKKIEVEYKQNKWKTIEDRK